MSYPTLKKIAIDTIDDLTGDEVLDGYGIQYTAKTLLDDIQITAPVRAVMPPLVNKKFRAAYTQDWKVVRPIDTVKCQTIGDFIKLVAKNAGEVIPDGEPK
jgi:hypothetical protein